MTRLPPTRLRMLWVATALVVVLGLGAVLAAGLRRADQSGATTSANLTATTALETPAPALTGTTIDGTAFDLASLRGRPVLVNIWASWCEACRDELRILETAANRWGQANLAVVGIDVRDADDKARELITASGATSVTTVVDRTGSKAVAWGVRGVPETYLVDRDGQVRVQARGPITEEWLRQWIEPRVAS